MKSYLAAGMPIAVKLGLPLAGMAVVAAACSSGSQPGYGAGAAAPATGKAAGTPATTSITTASGEDGTFLTDGSGRALYLWAADGKNASSCAGGCAGEWPPLIASGTPKAAAGASAVDIGTITRSDGSTQVTYNGHALYYFAGDTKPGQTEGQGSDDFGADWWLVAPDGTKITAGATDNS